MYSGFNLKINAARDCGPDSINFLDPSYIDAGKKHLGDAPGKVHQELEDMVLKGTDILDGVAIQDDWFPEINADIFISHSHGDCDLANGIAGWMNEEFGLRCFIDSNVWGYTNDLLRILNDQYSDKRKGDDGGIVYTHEKCNRAANHVNTMLTIALQKMIDRCECVLFLNTDQSILPYETTLRDATDSPWIYSEIVCTQLIRHKELKEYRKEIFHGDQRVLFEASEGFHPAYSVSLDHMMPLNMGDLMEWEQNYPKNTPKHHPLDYLYKQLAARN